MRQFQIIRYPNQFPASKRRHVPLHHFHARRDRFGGHARAAHFVGGRAAEQALEFAAELRGAFIAHAHGCRAHVHAVVRNQETRVMQARGLHVLHRRGGRHRLEVRMKHREAHARLGGERHHVEVAAIVGVNAAQRLGDAAEMLLMRERRANRVALLAREHAIADLAHDRRPENARVRGLRERFEQTQHGVRQRCVERRGIDARRLGDGAAARVVERHQQLGDHRQIDAHRDRENRLLGRGFGLAFERQRHREHEILLRVVDEHLIAEKAALAALANDENARLVHDRLARMALAAAKQAHAVERRLMRAVSLRELHHQLDHAALRGVVGMHHGRGARARDQRRRNDRHDRRGRRAVRRDGLDLCCFHGSCAPKFIGTERESGLPIYHRMRTRVDRQENQASLR
ncbi:hypothetical protein PT2222_190095 [Paraburkholderia tropica]